jgi:transposase-like protein/ribosomal protein L37AE/L43A
MKFTIKAFHAKYPDDDACLEEIYQNRLERLVRCPNPKCERTPAFHKVEGRKCWACQWCGYQLHPLADTIFHKSETSLKSWFYAIWLFSNSKNGVSAKELERQLGVTYKTAWRMAKQIRLLFVQTQVPLSGKVEVDETYMGGRESNKHYRARVSGSQGRSVKTKTPIIGMLERGGPLVAQVVDSNKANVVRPLIRRNVRIGSQLLTDEFKVYQGMDGYKHKTVNHNAHQYVKGYVHTNSIEGFWSQLKRSINGTYHAVSPKHLQSYVNEFAYRYERRNLETPLFFPMVKMAGRPVL